jgi:hypothetical protein
MSETEIKDSEAQLLPNTRVFYAIWIPRVGWYHPENFSVDISDAWKTIIKKDARDMLKIVEESFFTASIWEFCANQVN